MASAPRLNAAQKRNLANMRAQAEHLAAFGGHEITWEGTFSASDDGGTTLYRVQDGWCLRGGRSHLRAAIAANKSNVHWSFGRPTDRCPG